MIQVYNDQIIYKDIMSVENRDLESAVCLDMFTHVELAVFRECEFWVKTKKNALAFAGD